MPQSHPQLEGSARASDAEPRSSSALAIFAPGTRRPVPDQAREDSPSAQDARGWLRRANCFVTVSH